MSYCVLSDTLPDGDGLQLESGGDGSDGGGVVVHVVHGVFHNGQRRLRGRNGRGRKRDVLDGDGGGSNGGHASDGSDGSDGGLVGNVLDDCYGGSGVRDVIDVVGVVDGDNVVDVIGVVGVIDGGGVVGVGLDLSPGPGVSLDLASRGGDGLLGPVHLVGAAGGLSAAEVSTGARMRVRLGEG